MGLAFRRVWGGVVETSLHIATTLAWVSFGARATVHLVPQLRWSPTVTLGVSTFTFTEVADECTSAAAGRGYEVHLSGENVVAVCGLVGVDALLLLNDRSSMHWFLRAGGFGQPARTFGSAQRRDEIAVANAWGLAVEIGIGVAF